MAILIDMPMPHDCGECVFMVDGWCYCIKAEDWQSKKVEFEERPDWCPLREVVRCKDCKYGDTGIDEEGKRFWKCLGIHYGGTKPDDFCSYGERREE